MGKGGRGMNAACAGLLAALALSWPLSQAAAQDHGRKTKTAVMPGAVAVETVYFADPQEKPVALVRGVPPQRPAMMQPAARLVPSPAPAVQAIGRQAAIASQSTQIVSFGSGFAEQVKIVRGGTFAPGGLARIERVAFNDPRQAAVSVVRGAAIRELFSIDLFGPANAGELDRIAFAVEGVESRHGADPGMWRPSMTAAQGPMQVTAAAAFDVCGGDRFDLYQNRLLGRAYLAQMYQRYGNWPDALAAYNWVPGSVDAWIAGGRLPERLPAGVAYYVARVLRDTLVASSRP